MIITFAWEPAGFVTVLFQLFFGLLMVVLDFPIPHPSPMLANVRAHIYKFFLFLTRFTGRGLWYLFLGTMIFATLFDPKKNRGQVREIWQLNDSAKLQFGRDR